MDPRPTPSGLILPIALPWFIVNHSPLSGPLVIIEGQRVCLRGRVFADLSVERDATDLVGRHLGEPQGVIRPAHNPEWSAVGGGVTSNVLISPDGRDAPNPVALVTR